MFYKSFKLAHAYDFSSVCILDSSDHKKQAPSQEKIYKEMGTKKTTRLKISQSTNLKIR
jgi:hypothetical protein